jgi:uncharacterized protein with ParB-like and HNH nuclease domain
MRRKFLKSDDITIQQLFQDRRQYMVPFYQRSYVWTLTDQWEQLWEDIQAKADARLLGNKFTPHFLGAVVLDPQPKTSLIGVDTLHIIDGQQRLTTLQFILKSISLALKSVHATAISEIISGTMLNGNPDTMRDSEIEKFKVWPTFRDRNSYRNALTAKDRVELKKRFPESFTLRETLRLIGIRHPAPLEAIWFFTDRFEQWIKQGNEGEISLRAENLASAILQDLKVVSIVLDEDDDAQVIFETLNGRGAQLHATDLIRNFIFMRADREGTDSEKLYNEFWSKFENQYWNTEQTRGRMKKPRLEWFIHASLQAELAEEIDLGRLYFEYRRYVFDGAEAKSAQNQLETLSKYAQHYKELIDGTEDSPIGIFGKKISGYDITTIHPLALLIAVSPLSNIDKNEMFRILVSYVVRRAIAGLTSKNYNNTFVSILRNLAKTEISAESLRSILSSLKGEASRWPDDEEFRNICNTRAIYPGTLDPPKMRSVLAELELALRQEVKTEDPLGGNLNQLDIDHITPKSWFDHWPLQDGSNVNPQEFYMMKRKVLLEEPLDEREKLMIERHSLIYTLGNLTLLNLSVNRSAQNKSFSLKKDLLLKNTNLRLNIPLLGLPTWDESEIKKRGKLLSEIAIRIWPGIKAEQSV